MFKQKPVTITKEMVENIKFEVKVDCKNTEPLCQCEICRERRIDERNYLKWVALDKNK